jgi:hypothetical protein
MAVLCMNYSNAMEPWLKGPFQAYSNLPRLYVKKGERTLKYCEDCKRK